VSTDGTPSIGPAGLEPSEAGGRRVHDRGGPIGGLAAQPTIFRRVGFTAWSWREQALARIIELEALQKWIDGTVGGAARPFTEAARQHLDMAQQAAEQVKPLKSLTGAAMQRALANIDAAEMALLRVAPPKYLFGKLPVLLAYVREHLPETDTRRTCMERIAGEAIERARHLNDNDREMVLSAVHDAGVEARKELVRVRSFRDFLLAMTTLLIIFAFGVALFGAANPDKVPLCFRPMQRDGLGTVVCPAEENAVKPGVDVDTVVHNTVSSWDIPLIEGVGLIAALVAATSTVRRIRGTSTPYGLPLALAALKLPAGALTAVVGLLLMRGQFIPGLSDLDTSAQIIAWAAVFGYSQQILTQFLDQRAQSVLDDIRGPGTGPT
jgi:hypothetical protein